MKYNINKVKQGSVSIKVVKPDNNNEVSSRPPPAAEQEKPSNVRPSWIQYFIEIARTVSSRSSCLRHKIGAVLVKNKQILSTGFNGAPSGRKDCLQAGLCYRNEKGIKGGTQLERCASSGAHAEMNTIALAARHGISTEGADLFLVGAPYSVCTECRAILLNAGINKAYIEDTKTGIIEVVDIKREWNKHPIEDEPEFRRKCKSC